MKRALITIVILGLLVLAGIFIWQDDSAVVPTEDQTATTTEDEQASDDQAGVPEEWQEYQSEEFDFTIAHPPEADVRIEAGNHVKFTILGPQNEPNTEIADGYTLTVSTYQKEETQTLEDFAEARLQEDLQIADEVEGVSETTFKGETSYSFTTQNLGVVEHLAVDHGGDRAVVVSWNVSDPNDAGYQEEVDLMLESLTLHEESPPMVSRVSLAFLDVTPEGEPERGCDDVSFVEYDIEPTTAPLTAALERLFSLEEGTVQGNMNFIEQTSETLSFDRASVAEGIAHIYLTGRLSGLSGVCDNPRAAIQIEETALQFETVEEVMLYLNGEETDLTPSERGE